MLERFILALVVVLAAQCCDAASSSKTPSLTRTVTVTISDTISESRTVSNTPSTSRSMKTPSTSRSNSRSPSTGAVGTPASTPTPSNSATPNSATPTPSNAAPVPGPSVSGTASSSDSPSPSALPSLVAGASLSMSASSQASRTRSKSRSSSKTPTCSSSETMTASGTASETGSILPSPSSSESTSESPSQTSSLSDSPSTGAPPSDSASVAGSPLASTTRSNSRTQPPSVSSTASPTQSRSTTEQPSDSMVPLASASPSMSESATSSFEPDLNPSSSPSSSESLQMAAPSPSTDVTLSSSALTTTTSAQPRASDAAASETQHPSISASSPPPPPLPSPSSSPTNVLSANRCSCACAVTGCCPNTTQLVELNCAVDGNAAKSFGWSTSKIIYVIVPVVCGILGLAIGVFSFISQRRKQDCPKPAAAGGVLKGVERSISATDTRPQSGLGDVYPAGHSNGAPPSQQGVGSDQALVRSATGNRRARSLKARSDFSVNAAHERAGSRKGRWLADLPAASSNSDVDQGRVAAATSGHDGDVEQGRAVDSRDWRDEQGSMGPGLSERKHGSRNSRGRWSRGSDRGTGSRESPDGRGRSGGGGTGPSRSNAWLQSSRKIKKPQASIVTLENVRISSLVGGSEPLPTLNLNSESAAVLRRSRRQLRQGPGARRRQQKPLLQYAKSDMSAVQESDSVADSVIGELLFPMDSSGGVPGYPGSMLSLVRSPSLAGSHASTETLARAHSLSRQHAQQLARLVLLDEEQPLQVDSGSVQQPSQGSTRASGSSGSRRDTSPSRASPQSRRRTRSRSKSHAALTGTSRRRHTKSRSASPARTAGRSASAGRLGRLTHQDASASLLVPIGTDGGSAEQGSEPHSHEHASAREPAVPARTDLHGLRWSSDSQMDTAGSNSHRRVPTAHAAFTTVSHLIEHDLKIAKTAIKLYKQKLRQKEGSIASGQSTNAGSGSRSGAASRTSGSGLQSRYPRFVSNTEELTEAGLAL